MAFNPTAARNQAAIGRSGGGGVQVYSPTRRVTPQPAAPRFTPPTRNEEEDWVSFGRRFARGEAQPVQQQQQEEPGGDGIADGFFNSTVGRGVGMLLGNPIVSGILQPMDLINVPARIINSTVNESMDFVNSGSETDASLQDWYDQINPFAAIHGENMEDSIGWGDTLREQTGGEGTGNRWADAAIGFAGDVAFDPATYIAGLGVASKGLGAARAGTRLGQAARAANKVQGKTSKAAREIISEARPGTKSTPMSSLTGRPTRQGRGAEAMSLFRQVEGQGDAGLEALARYSDDFDNLSQAQRVEVGRELLSEARQEVLFRSQRGLGSVGPTAKANPAVNDVVETALNVKAPGLRMRGISDFQGNVVGDANRAVGRKLGDITGGARQKINQSNLGQKLIAADATSEYGKSVAQMANATDVDDFDLASRAFHQTERARPSTGGYLVPGQRAVKAQRKEILDDVKKEGGVENYIRRAETKGDTRLNELNRFLGDELPDTLGVTIPKLDSDLNYVQRMITPKVQRILLNLDNQTDAAAREKWHRLVGGEGESSLQGESGRLMRRAQYEPGEVIDLGDGRKIDVGDGTIADINASAKQVLGHKIFVDDPVKLLEDYVQSVSEDVGRRAARADDIALSQGAGDQRYAPGLSEQMRKEATKEQIAARRRMGLDEEVTVAVEKALESGKVPVDPNRPWLGPDDSQMPVPAEDIASINKNIANGNLLEAVQRNVADWEAVGENKAVIQSPEYQNIMTGFTKELADKGMVNLVFRKLTNFFKTYATLSPGFHVRNGMSAIFMNLADGVGLKTVGEGADLWRRFAKASRNGTDPSAGLDFLYKDISPQERDALLSVMGSGAGGRFAESGVATRGSRLMENWLTRKSQDAGAWVEGSARTGMALDTIMKGGSIDEAVQRITRVQFDYSQVSQFDQRARAYFPFWSFMSRNLPLQVMQQWSRPAAYSIYEDFKNNFGDPTALAPYAGEDIPDYIQDGGGMPLNLGPLGNWFEPDLPHTRLHEEVGRLEAMGEGDFLPMLSNLNPLMSAPVEFTTGRDAFTGQTFDETDLEHVSNPLEALAAIPAGVLGGTKQGDAGMFIDERYLNLMNSINPLFARAGRMSGSGGQEDARVAEAWARWLGLPVRNITERQIENTQLGREFDAADAARVQAILDGTGS